MFEAQDFINTVLVRPNKKKIPVNLEFFRFSGKNIILCILNSKCLKKSRKKILNKICVPTLPKIFRSVT